MKNKRIYLCGPIAGRSDLDCIVWRALVKDKWSGVCLDPMDRDYRGQDHIPGIEVQIVEQDKRDIDESHGLLVYFDRPSVGTSMEILYAWQAGKPIVIINSSSSRSLSPWLRYHSNAIVNTIDEALAHLSVLL